MSNDSWEYDVGLTNAPPRRRTEPAITVPSEQHPERIAVGDRVIYLGIQDSATSRVLMVNYESRRIEVLNESTGRSAEVYFWPGRWAKVDTVMAPHFEPAEIEACKAHGSDRYAKQAMVCDEAREEQARDDEDTDRRACAEYFEWYTYTDSHGEDATRTHRMLDEEEARIRNARAALPRPLPGELPSDYAGRCKMNTAKTMGISYDEWAERVRLEMAAVAEGRPVE